MLSNMCEQCNNFNCKRDTCCVTRIDDELHNDENRRQHDALTINDSSQVHISKASCESDSLIWSEITIEDDKNSKYNVSTILGTSQQNDCFYNCNSLTLSNESFSLIDNVLTQSKSLESSLTNANNTDLRANVSRNCNQKSIKCASLNVCGLKRKVLFPEFCNLVNNYDLFCVCETKLDKYDTIELAGYDFLSQNRKQKFIRKSGGIGVFVKQSISEHVSLINSDSDYVL